MGDPFPSDETGDLSPSPPSRLDEERDRGPQTVDFLPQDPSAFEPSEQRTAAARTNDGAAPVLPDGAARLELTAEIACGGMGVIHRGRDLALGRDIAVKVLRDNHADNAEFVRRFVEEARIAGRLQHPGVAPVYELGVLADRRPYFTMKLVEGKTLSALLAARGDLLAELPRFVGIFAQVCQTLAYAHARGVLHRDLKPSNVMVGAFGEVQVVDWGLAKVLPHGGAIEPSQALQSANEELAAESSGVSGSDSYTQAGTLLGTPAYMPPEQARGDMAHVDERADVFGLGAILCEVLTGKPPFAGRGKEATRQARKARLEDAYARLDGCGADAELIALAKRCLAVEAADRPRDAGKVADEVTAYQQAVNERLRQAELERAAAAARAEEEGRTRLMAEAKAREERKRRQLTVALAAAVFLLFLLGGGGWTWVRQQEEKRLAESTKREQMRLAETTRRVDRALGEAQFLRGQAESIGEPERWSEAAAAAQRAEAVADSGAVPALKQRAAELRADIERAAQAAKARAAQVERDRRLIAQLLEIRSSARDRLKGGDQDFAGTDARYTQALRDYGLDLDALAPQQAGDWLAKVGQGVRVELAACLDDWAHARRMIDGENWARANRLSAIARALDPDWLRGRIRIAIDGRNRFALKTLAVLPAVLNAPPSTVNLLAVYLGFWGDTAAAIRILRFAQRGHPGDFQINHNLSWFLLYVKDPPMPVEALRFATAALATRPQSLAARLVMADAHFRLKRFDEAANLYRELVRRQPQPWLHRKLAGTLLSQGKLDEAIPILREAIRSDPANAWAHNNLRRVLLARGKLEEAFAECVISGSEEDRAKLMPAFVQQGRLEEARAIWQKILETNPPGHNAWYGYAELCLYLGREDEYRRARTALLARFGNTKDVQIAERTGRTCLLLPASEDEWRQANALADLALAAGPRFDLYPYFQLVKGLAEYRHDRPEQAIPWLSASAEGVPLLASHLILALAQYRSQRPMEARQTLASALASYNWDEAAVVDVAGWINHVLRREAEESIVPNLAAFLKGQFQPNDNRQRLALIEPCRFRKHYRAAVRLYADAFAADANLAGALKPTHRYNAACCAALAGAGKDAEDSALDAKERDRCLKLALDWLRADLDAFAKLLAGGKPEERTFVRRRLQAWMQSNDLATVRDKNALAKLPAEMRDAYNKLWTEFENLWSRDRKETGE
jgi:tetratricopeptide (TPR) repeat protein